MYIVVGSGHAGIACAVTLVEAGFPVTMIDGGINLEASTERVVQKMADQSHTSWDPEDLAVVKGTVSASAKGVQVKKLFGSDFPFRDVDHHIPRDSSRIGHLTPSLATAGFSNVWGAAALPFSEKDLKGWPITSSDLSPFYASVARFMRLTGEADGLSALFPLYTDNPDTLRPSRQGQRILTSLRRREETLKKRGFIFGSPRVAVRGDSTFRTSENQEQTGCSYCGLCLFGCPYGHIYSSRDTLRHLKTFANFKHIPDIVIESIQESGSHAQVRGYSRIDRSPVSFIGTKVFLGAGLLSTSKLLMTSMAMYDIPVMVKTSEYFMLPILSLLKTKDVQKEALHTLSQLFIECITPEISTHSSHMQLYTYSEHFKLGLYETFGLLRPLLKTFEGEILGRLNVIQGYLHSDTSSRIELRLKKTSHGDVLCLEGKQNPAGAATIKKLVSRLTRALLPSGLIPVRPMLNIGLPGEGRHAGGSFPMRATPGPGECDVLGRPYGFTNVHVVDATVFPTIPASTITFTAMANAQRIASQVVSQSIKTDERIA